MNLTFANNQCYQDHIKHNWRSTRLTPCHESTLPKSLSIWAKENEWLYISTAKEGKYLLVHFRSMRLGHTS